MSTNDKTNEPVQGELPDDRSQIERWLEPSPPLPVDGVDREAGSRESDPIASDS
jgi:hypothetical protein